MKRIAETLRHAQKESHEDRGKVLSDSVVGENPVCVRGICPRSKCKPRDASSTTDSTVAVCFWLVFSVCGRDPELQSL